VTEVSERRESLLTQESDLMDTCNLIKPAEEDGTMPLVVPGLSLLSIPVRLKNPALRKPEFLVDVAAFGSRSPAASSPKPVTSTRQRGKARRRPAPLQIPLSASILKRPSNPAFPTAALPSAERTRAEFIENSFEPVLLSRPTRTPLTPPRNDAKTATVPSSAKSLGWRFCVPSEVTRSIGGKKPSRLDLRAVFSAGIRNE
jgi:hypothetical protein